MASLAAFEARHLHRPRHSLGKIFGGNAVQSGKKAEILDHLQIVVEGKFLRHVADPLANCFRLLWRRPVPATRARPAEGSSRPHRMRIVVDFPAPFGPRKPKISPRRASKLTLFTATNSPKRLSGPRPPPKFRCAFIRAFCASRRFRSVSTADTNKSSMVGVTDWMESTSTPADSSRARKSDCAARGVVHKQVHAVALEQGAAHAGGACQRFAHLDGLRRMYRQNLAGKFPLEFLRPVAEQHAALVQQADAMAALGFVEIGSGNENGHALGHEGIENPPEIAARHRIDAVGGLVE